jgi:hypothetical protein
MDDAAELGIKKIKSHTSKFNVGLIPTLSNL